MSSSTKHSDEKPPHTPPRNILRILRFFIAALILIGLTAVVVIKINADQMLLVAPEFTHLYWPLLLLTYVVLACYEVFLVALWILTKQVQSERIFDPHSLRFIAYMRGACWVATIASFAILTLVPGPPALAGLIMGTIILLVVIALTLSVMSHLLVQASEYRTELKAVI